MTDRDRQWSGSHGGGVDQMLRQEPDLKLVSAQHVGGEQIVCAVVAALRRLFDGVADLFDDDLVRLEEPGEHGGHLLGAIRWTGGRW